MVHRLFLGMPLPAEAAAILHEWAQKHLPAYVRPVPLENLHVTLAFFGERSETELLELQSLVRGITWRGIQVRTGSLQRLGRNAIAIALDVTSGSTALSSVAARLGGHSKRGTSQLHVTVGRPRTRPNLDDVLQPPELEFTLAQLHLFTSTLSPQGAQYTIVAGAR